LPLHDLYDKCIVVVTKKIIIQINAKVTYDRIEDKAIYIYILSIRSEKLRKSQEIDKYIRKISLHTANLVQ